MIPIKIISPKKLKVIWQITTACTYKCSYCPTELNQGKSHQINLDELQTFLDKIKDRNPVFSFTGGEPTVHPQYLDILRELKKRNFSVISDSNLSRTVRFYEEATQLVDNWNVTLHPSEHTLDLDKIKAISHSSYAVVYLMADPRHWELSMSWFEELKKILRIKIIILKPLNNWSNSGWFYHDYTQEQLDFYENTAPILNFTQEEVKQGLIKYSWLQDQGSTIMWNDGSVDKLDPDQLMKNDLNKFQGWDCEVGSEVIVINPTSNISLGTCGTRHLGNWNNFTIDMLEQSFLCPREYCHCGTDIKATKTKQ